MAFPCHSASAQAFQILNTFPLSDRSTSSYLSLAKRSSFASLSFKDHHCMHNSADELQDPDVSMTLPPIRIDYYVLVLVLFNLLFSSVHQSMHGFTMQLVGIIMGLSQWFLFSECVHQSRTVSLCTVLASLSAELA
jgi:hypothetical protein